MQHERLVRHISGLRAVLCHEFGSLAFIAGLGAVLSHEADISACGAVILGPVGTVLSVLRIVLAVVSCWI